jgi:hypothetical protein
MCLLDDLWVVGRGSARERWHGERPRSVPAMAWRLNPRCWRSFKDGKRLDNHHRRRPDRSTIGREEGLQKAIYPKPVPKGLGVVPGSGRRRSDWPDGLARIWDV